MRKRWYDKYKDLAKHLDGLKDAERKTGDRCIQEIMALIRDKSPNLLDDFVMDFPLPLFRRRWYDKNPHLWLIFNGLRYADRQLLEDVAALLATIMNAKMKPNINHLRSKRLKRGEKKGRENRS